MSNQEPHTPEAPSSSRVAFATFMDNVAKFELQSLYWARSLVETGTARKPDDIFLFVPQSLAQRKPKWATSLRIQIIAIPYFDHRHPYCNKIGLWTNQYFARYTHVCFTDCDLFFVRRPDLPVANAIVAGVVDRPNPPWPQLSRIFQAAGLRIPSPVPTRWPRNHSDLTAPTNCNGGFYFVDRTLIDPLGGAWGYWARWLLGRQEIAEPLRSHVDQVSLALALVEKGFEVKPLPREINAPTHLGPLPSGPATPPSVIHYHSRLSSQGELLGSGDPVIDQSIAAANRMIEGWKRTSFNNRVFWNARYALHPQLGSGIGSRAAILGEKRRLLAPLATQFKSTIDIGCGDLEVTRGLPFKDYLGVDVSEQALITAQQKEPMWRFSLFEDFEAGIETAELVLCLDVIIHQPTFRQFSSLINLAVSRAEKVALISGFDGTPIYSSGITFYYEPLRSVLGALPEISRVQRVGSYRDLVVYAAVKNGGRLDVRRRRANARGILRAFRRAIRGSIPTPRKTQNQ